MRHEHVELNNCQFALFESTNEGPVYGRYSQFSKDYQIVGVDDSTGNIIYAKATIGEVDRDLLSDYPIYPLRVDFIKKDDYDKEPQTETKLNSLSSEREIPSMTSRVISSFLEVMEVVEIEDPFKDNSDNQDN
jgi:hypothetical protein